MRLLQYDDNHQQRLRAGLRRSLLGASGNCRRIHSRSRASRIGNSRPHSGYHTCFAAQVAFRRSCVSCTGVMRLSPTFGHNGSPSGRTGQGRMLAFRTRASPGLRRTASLARHRPLGFEVSSVKCEGFGQRSWYNGGAILIGDTSYDVSTHYDGPRDLRG